MDVNHCLYVHRRIEVPIRLLCRDIAEYTFEFINSLCVFRDLVDDLRCVQPNMMVRHLYTAILDAALAGRLTEEDFMGWLSFDTSILDYDASLHESSHANTASDVQRNRILWIEGYLDGIVKQAVRSCASMTRAVADPTALIAQLESLGYVVTKCEPKSKPKSGSSFGRL